VPVSKVTAPAMTAAAVQALINLYMTTPSLGPLHRVRAGLLIPCVRVGYLAEFSCAGDHKNANFLRSQMWRGGLEAAHGLHVALPEGVMNFPAGLVALPRWCDTICDCWPEGCAVATIRSWRRIWLISAPGRKAWLCVPKTSSRDDCSWRRRRALPFAACVSSQNSLLMAALGARAHRSVH